MSIVETVLVFVGIPLAVVLAFAALTLGPGAVHTPRYRPGSAWEFRPVWYLPHPEHLEQPGPVSALQASGSAEVSQRLASHATVASPVKASGGASGEW